MDKPNFEESAKRVEEYAQNLSENYRLGESKLMLAFAEMLKAMAWQSSQADTNNIQVANLIAETKALKELTETNARSSSQNENSANKLSKVAIGIAITSLVFQVLFSIHQESGCIWSSVSSDDPGYIHYSGCYRSFDFGLLGKYSINLNDKREPNNIK